MGLCTAVGEFEEAELPSYDTLAWFVGAVVLFAAVPSPAGALLRRNARVARGGQLVSGGAYLAMGITAVLIGEKPALST